MSNQLTILKEINPFLTVLYAAVQNPNSNHIICWDSSGKHLVIKNEKLLQTELIPDLFNNIKIESFYRQLNNYTFARVSKYVKVHPMF